MKQFVLPFEPDGRPGDITCPIQGKGFHYLVHVRRCRPGDRIHAVSPSMVRYSMLIKSIEKRQCLAVLSLDGTDETVQEFPDPAITIMPAILKNRKLDLVVRQAVESEVYNIWPLLTEHTEVRFHSPKDSLEKTERWKRIASEALQQCGGRFPTVILPPMPMAKALEKWNNQGPVLFLHEKPVGNDNVLKKVDIKGKLAMITGPEGGLSNAEVQQLIDAGARGVNLSNRILRAETAILYGIASVSTIAKMRKQCLP